MKASKILLGSVFFLSAVATALVASAAPRAAEASGIHYLIAADDLAPLHLGGFYRYQERDVSTGSLTQNKAAMLLGYDLLPWASVYGFLGTSRIRIEPLMSGDSDAAMEYGGGAWINILDHDVLGDLTMETRMRLQALGQISHSTPEVNGRDYSCTELYATLTLSLVTEVIGNKNYWPDAVGLFAGPVFNTVESDDFDDEGSDLGIALGLDFYITRGITASVAYEAFETDGALNAGLDFRF